ncbi:peptidyl-prolyl cis-trans isomerase SurA [Loktanella ponticola]|uniref:Parvulin-like PPIase n=1 Tax=Yoonia ponticola TaxID=1524255 RepID=A0A7W9BJZ9_9RHOB|nr:peptidylprolyl isomerase [Yoonia ponticola]MBB5721968.1 peptidyl-prolyl cis-trans isomerase SurA [Yoonia ponticola]
MRALNILCSLIALTVGFSPLPTAAQSQFGPSITVNNTAITGYEIDQRAKLLELFRTPGAGRSLAQEQLIEDRLKQSEMDKAGLQLADGALQTSLEEFAGRANLTLDQFYAVLSQNGVAPETLRDFVEIGVTWRDYVRSRFGSRVQITEGQIDRALASSGATTDGIEVLLSEIIIPAPPPQAASATATAERIAQTRSTATFSAEARRVSALPSKNNGGQLGWLPISNYPPQLRSLILGLGTGEVTAPIQIPNGVALFQMRGVREVPTPRPVPSAIEYAAYYMGGGQSAARALADQVDTCDDLYGVAQGQPAEVLERDSLAPADIPQDVALELARLDAGEVSYNLTRANGQTTVFLMLCNRVSAGQEGVDRDAVRNQLRGTLLAGFADALLADLRATATITGQ